MKERETFGSRLGFILVSAGCAVGLGNVWKFPYLCGQYGGAAFILIYLAFLVILGFPILICEYAVGRGSRKSCAAAFQSLEPEGSRFHLYGYFGMAGNYGLMMYYTMVTGWLLYYCYKSLTGEFSGNVLSSEQINEAFNDVLASPGLMIGWMIVGVILSFGICSLGLQNGVERVTKVFMIILVVLMVVLAVHSVFLAGASEGLKFYLVPDFQRMKEIGIGSVVFAAMSQAFFTLSLGIGAMAIAGSHMKKEYTLTGEALHVLILDTLVAIVAGLIIIPSCFAFGIEPDAGPSLIFITLPAVFNQMTGGRIWGSMFFVFLSFAALSTEIVVFENIISFAEDLWGWERRKAILINIVAMILLSIPCILGYNILSGVQPLGEGSTIMDLEDFLVSNNLLPLGSLIFVAFCVVKNGWGWDNFLSEANTGKGRKFPAGIRMYMTYLLPAIIIIIYLQGYWDKFKSMGSVYLIPWMAVAIGFLVLIGWFIFGKKKK